MNLYFEDRKGQMRLISTPATVKAMWEDMRRFMDDRNFKSYYTRINFGKNDICFDVGSWSEFFHLQDFTEDDVIEIAGGSVN